MQNLLRGLLLGTWKSILKARNVILLGAKWRVGNGLSIRVFEDSWLPAITNGRVIYIHTIFNNSMQVAELIDSNSGGWYTRVIEETFVLIDAQKIKAIPLCAVPQPDLLYWSLEKNGVYSNRVTKVYVMKQGEEALGSNSMAETGFWSSIWKLQVPGKVKHFLWEACLNSLPTKQSLMKRMVPSDLVCHLCRTCTKDTMHALWGCVAAKQVWSKEFNWVNQFGASQGLFLDLVAQIM